MSSEARRAQVASSAYEDGSSPRRVLASDSVDLEQLERQLREWLDALGPAPRAELLHVLMLPDFERADRIGAFWATQRAAPSPSC
jgi:hypothetical protein